MSPKPAPKDHPFCLTQRDWGRLTVLSPHFAHADVAQAVLRLPTTRTGPLPSPGLHHAWDLDEESEPRLAPWRVCGLAVSGPAAAQALLDLPELQASDCRVVLSDDLLYWRSASGLVLEVLAAQRLVPSLKCVDGHGQLFHARWTPVLDGPGDAARLARLAAAMPPVCRAEAAHPDEPLTPRMLLDSFLHVMADRLSRDWGRDFTPRFADAPADRWLAALFNEDPKVAASPAQVDALARSHRAWLRNLHVSGDAAFAIAFRLEAPLQQAAERPVHPGTWQLHYLLQSRDDASLLVPADVVWKTRGRVLKELGTRFEQPQEKLLGGLGYAARLFPPIASSLKASRPTSIALSTEQAYAFLREAAPILSDAGFSLLAPPWWNQPGTRLGVRLRLRPSRGRGSESVTRGSISFEKLVQYEWEVSLGETTLSRQEFEALVALKSPLVQIRGQWVRLDAEQVEAAIRFWDRQHQGGELTLPEALVWGLDAQASAGGLEVMDVAADGWLSDWLARLSGRQALEDLPQPDGLQGQLRPYQRLGFSWLHFLCNCGLGACLADDMGLGKTVQTLALLLQLKHERAGAGPALLICPTSIVTNWEREVRRFTPSLGTLVHQGSDRLRGDEFVQAAGVADIVLTTYPVVRRDDELLRSVPWRAVILDEAQNIKDPSARQTQAIRELRADFHIALTGTPVENRLSELWSIMHFLNPGYLGSRERFRREFSLPIERCNDPASAERLKKLVRPLLLRRVKTDPRVIRDLPQKLENKEYCTLTEEQATLYESVVQDALRRVETSAGIERRGLVLGMLMRLKQICNHPVQYLHQGEAADAQSAEVDGRSGKLSRLTELLAEIVSVGDRTLIFSQFAEMGQILRAYLPGAVGCQTLFLHGGVPAARRDQMVKRFQDDGNDPIVFVLSLKAGGTGLNLTRANHVIHFDRWWNPAVEDQATDRAFRIGQTRNVQVHKFVTAGTLEEMIDDMLEKKKALAQAVVGMGEDWLTELSTDDLRDLVRLRR